jgi:hypothetical protein
MQTRRALSGAPFAYGHRPRSHATAAPTLIVIASAHVPITMINNAVLMPRPRAGGERAARRLTLREIPQ